MAGCLPNSNFGVTGQTIADNMGSQNGTGCCEHPSLRKPRSAAASNEITRPTALQRLLERRAGIGEHDWCIRNHGARLVCHCPCDRTGIKLRIRASNENKHPLLPANRQLRS